MGQAALKLEIEERRSHLEGHKHFGHEIEDCPKHGQMRCGIFGHYCPDCRREKEQSPACEKHGLKVRGVFRTYCLACEPAMAQPCGNCGARRYQCSC